MKVLKHCLRAVEIFFDPMRVYAAIRFPDLCWNGSPAVIGGGSQKKIRRKTDRSDAVSRKAVFPADLLALESLVTCEKMPAKSIPPLENHRQPLIRLAQPVV